MAQNLQKTQDALEFATEDQLIGLVESQKGIESMLAAGELNNRNRIRQSQQTPPNQPTVAQDVVQQATGGMSSLRMPIPDNVPPEMAQGINTPPGMPPGMPQGMPQGMPPGMPPTTQMAMRPDIMDGGVTGLDTPPDIYNMNNGGIIGFVDRGFVDPDGNYSGMTMDEINRYSMNPDNLAILRKNMEVPVDPTGWGGLGQDRNPEADLPPRGSRPFDFRTPEQLSTFEQLGNRPETREEQYAQASKYDPTTLGLPSEEEILKTIGEHSPPKIAFDVSTIRADTNPYARKIKKGVGSLVEGAKAYQSELAAEGREASPDKPLAYPAFNAFMKRVQKGIRDFHSGAVDVTSDVIERYVQISKEQAERARKELEGERKKLATEADEDDKGEDVPTDAEIKNLRDKAPKKVVDKLDAKRSELGFNSTRAFNNWLIETGLGMGGDGDARSTVDAFFRSGKPAFANVLSREAKRADRKAELDKIEQTIKGQLDVVKETVKSAETIARGKTGVEFAELTATLAASPAVQSAVDDTVKNLMERSYWLDRSFPVTFGPEGAPDLGIPGLAGQTFQTKTELERYLTQQEVRNFVNAYGIGALGSGTADTTGFTVKKVK